MNIEIYTDGSCHTQQRFGAWAAILFINHEKVIIAGVENDTTHNRMELLAVIKSLEYAEKVLSASTKITVNSDSQYVVNLPTRMGKLMENNFITKAGKLLHNNDLLLILITQISRHRIEFTKIKAHQKDGNVYNREVDLIVRKLVRENIK